MTIKPLNEPTMFISDFVTAAQIAAENQTYAEPGEEYRIAALAPGRYSVLVVNETEQVAFYIT